MNAKDTGCEDTDSQTTGEITANPPTIDSSRRVNIDNEKTEPDKQTAGSKEHIVNESLKRLKKESTKVENTSISEAFPSSEERVSQSSAEASNCYNEGEETPKSSPRSEEHRFNESLKEAEEQYVYFWLERDAFSQWHKSPFKLDGKEFCCAEQYMMYMKAVLLHDDRLAGRILMCTDPRRIKSLGRQTEQFSEDLWVHNCLHVVKEGNLAKFRQNQGLEEILFRTYPCVLVEASPYDKVWGIGLKKWDPSAWNEATWEGKNLLGYILTEVRDELMCERDIILERDKKVYFEQLTKDLKENAFGRKFKHDRGQRHHNRGGFNSDQHSYEVIPRVCAETVSQAEGTPVDTDTVEGEWCTVEKRADNSTSEQEMSTNALEQKAVDREKNADVQKTHGSLEIEGAEMEWSEENANIEKEMKLTRKLSNFSEADHIALNPELDKTNAFVDMSQKEEGEKRQHCKVNKNEHQSRLHTAEIDTSCTGQMKPNERLYKPEYKSSDGKPKSVQSTMS